jgi:hypothetical protein
MKENRKKTTLGRGIVIPALIGLFLASLYPAYRISEYFFNRHFDRWGNRLIDLDKQNKLSHDFDIWKDADAAAAMDSIARDLSGKDDTTAVESFRTTGSAEEV